jgi:predicted RecB family nuclease
VRYPRTPGGDWSMAQHIKAVETEDENLRRETMDSIRQYNKEDLEATWAVMEWLRSIDTMQSNRVDGVR